jgi:hypothetical protein
MRPSDSVFINVPFDRRYKKLFDALVFAVHHCGLVARCAREFDDGAQVRVDKLYKIIGECQFGIHDLSRTTRDSRHHLPRFNMPLELGIFLGARKFGDRRQQAKVCLILDRDPYRYQIFCSDIAGQDIRTHSNDVGAALAVVRDWIRVMHRRGAHIPGIVRMRHRYITFRRELPRMCRLGNLDRSELSFVDYRTLVSGWLSANP